ncbi:MAG: MFS transporter [Candidatus Lernaella stagnicola]|nr:MFS transporter [Candidatus Lernaella stagnicola]
MLFSAVTVFWLPVYFSDVLGFSGAQIGLLFALNAVTGMLAAFPAGLGNDRLSSRFWVVLGLLTQAVTLVWFDHVEAFAICIVAYFFWSMTFSLFRISIETQMLKTDSGDKTAQRIGVFVAWRFGGLGVGSLLAGFLLTRFGFHVTFMFVAIVCVVLIVPALLLPRTPVRRVNLREYAADFMDRRVLLFVSWMFLFCTHWGSEYTCYSLFLKKSLGLSLRQMGAYMAVEFSAFLFVGLLLAPRLRTMAIRNACLIGGLLASGIGLLGMVSSNVFVSVSFRFVHGLGDATMMVLIYLGIARLFNAERIGGSTGVVNLAMMTGLIVGALVASPVGEHFGYGVPIWASGMMLVLLALPVYLCRCPAGAPVHSAR